MQGLDVIGALQGYSDGRNRSDRAQLPKEINSNPIAARGRWTPRSLRAVYAESGPVGLDVSASDHHPPVKRFAGAAQLPLGELG